MDAKRTRECLLALSRSRLSKTHEAVQAPSSGASVSLEAPESLLWSDPLTGAEMKSALVRVDRGVTWESACAKLQERIELEHQEARRKEEESEQRRRGPGAAGETSASNRKTAHIYLKLAGSGWRTVLYMLLRPVVPLSQPSGVGPS